MTRERLVEIQKNLGSAAYSQIHDGYRSACSELVEEVWRLRSVVAKLSGLETVVGPDENGGGFF